MNFGTILFYLLWPAVWFYVPLVVRGRAVVLVDGEVLVVKNWFGPGLWQLPGGGIKFGESAKAAIDRELEEELGVKDMKGFMLTEQPVVYQRRGLLLRQQYALYKPAEKPNVRLSRELTDSNWLSIEEAPLPKSIRRILVEHQ